MRYNGPSLQSQSKGGDKLMPNSSGPGTTNIQPLFYFREIYSKQPTYIRVRAIGLGYAYTIVGWLHLYVVVNK